MKYNLRRRVQQNRNKKFGFEEKKPVRKTKKNTNTPLKKYHEINVPPPNFGLNELIKFQTSTFFDSI